MDIPLLITLCAGLVAAGFVVRAMGPDDADID